MGNLGQDSQMVKKISSVQVVSRSHSDEAPKSHKNYYCTCCYYARPPERSPKAHLASSLVSLSLSLADNLHKHLFGQAAGGTLARTPDKKNYRLRIMLWQHFALISVENASA